MRKHLFLLLLLGLAHGSVSQAQVTLALQVPAVGVMQKNQLWNMALLNAGNSSLNVVVELTLLSGKDNQPVMTAITKPILLNRGANQLNAKDLTPIQYNYLSPVFNVDRDPNGFLPIGNYKACYTVLQTAHNPEPLAEDCLPVEVQPLSPPQLNIPADTATLETAYPQFSWLPPLPLSLFSNLTYDMLVVEVLPGQGPYEAIQRNIPVYNISHYTSMLHAYPASNAPLDTGRIYAWRVIAKNEDAFVAQTEVWTFKLASVKPVVLKPANGNYILLKKSNEGAAGVSTLTENVIGIKYYSFDKDHEATVQFLTGDRSPVRSVREKIVYGDNFLAYPLNGAFQKGKLYLVEITDQQNNRYTASFTIKQSN